MLESGTELTERERELLLSDETKKVCTVCKKEFYTQKGNKWAYKRLNSKGKTCYYCSWSCFRKDDGSKSRKL